MKAIFFGLLAFVFLESATAQSVGIGTNTPSPSAQLDVSSTSRGLLIPRMTSAQRIAIANPVNGLLVYETTSKSIWFYNGGSWSALSSTGSNYWGTSGDNIYNTNNGNVGIGTISPTQKLDINGNIRIREDILSDGKVIATGIVSGSSLQTPGNLAVGGIGLMNGNFTTNGNLSVGGTSMLTGNITTIGDIIVNNTGATLQLRNGSNVNTGFFQLSGGNVRMGTNSGNNGQLVIRMNGNDRIRIDQGGNMDIEGQIYNSTATAGAPLLPKCYGYVNSDGTINSGTGNFSVTRETLGQYKITCAGISVNSIFLSSVPYQTATSSVFYDSPDNLLVRTWHTNSGTRTDRPFYFLVY